MRLDALNRRIDHMLERIEPQGKPQIIAIYGHEPLPEIDSDTIIINTIWETSRIEGMYEPG